MSVFIVIETPPGTKPAPSFLSNKLNSDWKSITLEQIRERCRISEKHAFSINGTNPVDTDGVTLQTFVELSPENSKVVAEAKDGKVVTITLKVISLKPEKKDQDNLDQSQIQGGLKALLGQASKVLDAGQLNDASKLLGGLASLKENYATNAVGSYTEPADLTEAQWENILFNNRMLHGYYYDTTRNVLVRARKRAFAIRHPSTYTGPADAALAHPSNGGASGKSGHEASAMEPTKKAKEYLNTLPGIPSFFVDDDANVAVIELQNAFQRRMAEQGFSYNAIEANAATKAFSKDASFSASWTEEESNDDEQNRATGQSTLQVRYSFPRVVVDLSPEYLQLSDECYDDIKKLTKKNKPEFERNYGNAFPTRIVLGGSLTSTRKVTLSQTSNLFAHKELMKQAAGLSFAAPQFSFGVTQAHITSKTTANASATSDQSAHLTWDARGGDTVLCSNPREWASTIKNHRYWRVIGQSHSIHLNDVVKLIDPTLFKYLEHPGVEAGDRFIEDLSDIVNGEETSEKYKSLEKLFNSQNSFKDFNDWLKKAEQENLVVKEGTKWADIEVDNPIGRDTKIQFGVWAFEALKIDVTSSK